MSDSESDTDRDIIQLQSALLAPANDVSFTSATRSIHFESCTKALEINEKCGEVLKLVQYRLGICLAKCLKRLENVRRAIHMKPLKRLITNAPISCNYKLGFPYFKDASDFPCPSNDDVEKINKFCIDIYPQAKVAKWTALDKTSLLNQIHLAAKKRRRYKIVLKMRKIQLDLENLKSQNEVNKNADGQLKISLRDCKRDLKLVESLSLKSLVQPLSENEEFDWEGICLEIGNKFIHTPKECRTMWRVFLHPEINKKQWSADERCCLTEIVKKNHLENWDKIAKDLNTMRSPYQCFLFYTLKIANSQNLSWNPQEDNYLKSLVQSCRIGSFIPWSKVSYYMENKSKAQCYNRWMYSISRNIKGRFLEEEDNVIRTGVKEFGLDFSIICQYLPHRKCSAVRRRYELLTSWQDNNPIPWDRRSDRELWRMTTRALQLNNNICFASIGKCFPYRSCASIRKRYLFLKNWVEKNPNNSIGNAPKTLKKSTQTGSFQESLKLLEKKLTTFEEKKFNKGKKVNEQISHYFQRNTSNTSLSLAPFFNPSTKADFVILRSILALLGAKLDKTLLNSRTLKRDELRDIAEKLLELDETTSSQLTPSKIKVMRTYSRKNNTKAMQSVNQLAATKETRTIWCSEVASSNLIESSHILPPTFNTLIAMRNIMLQKSGNDLNNGLCSPSDGVHLRKWNDRFTMLFKWPALLSNIPSCIQTGIFDDLLLENDDNRELAKNCSDLKSMVSNKNGPKKSQQQSVNKRPIDSQHYQIQLRKRFKTCIEDT